MLTIPCASTQILATYEQMRKMNKERQVSVPYMCVKAQTNKVAEAYGRDLAITPDNIPRQAVRSQLPTGW